jgi:hypothetical protein
MADDRDGAGGPQGATETYGAHYFGVGCFTALAGFAGGGMIAVLLAKIVGALTKCSVGSETGAPCHWVTYAFFGAIVGSALLPVLAITSLRRARRRTQNLDRG